MGFGNRNPVAGFRIPLRGSQNPRMYMRRNVSFRNFVQDLSSKLQRIQRRDRAFTQVDLDPQSWTKVLGTGAIFVKVL